MSLIGKLLGINLPAWIVEVAAVLAIGTAGLGWFAHHERGIELAKLQRSSEQAKAQAAKQIADIKAAHAAADQANQEKLDEAHNDVAAVSAQRDGVATAFAQWVRQHSGGSANGAVARPPGQPEAASDGGCGPRSCADLAVQLVQDGDDLARDLGNVSADLQACRRDRDSLTGLPK